MELYKIAIRALFAYVFLLVMIRVSGKRTVLQATPLDVTVSLIIGDMVDDALWAEVGIAQFVVGVTSVLFTHIAFGVLRVLPSQLGSHES